MINSPLHQKFHELSRKHILMLTLHGVHEWKVVPGLQDTGGQNVFVNQFSAALSKFGYKITIVNRGGYLHPRTGDFQKGLQYKDSYQRILYLDDGLDQFVRKEDMSDRFPELVESLTTFLNEDGLPLDLIISHYWDAGTIGCILKQKMELDIKHIWVPHSLGMVKKRNTPSEAWKDLRINARIEFEEKILSKLDFVAATSSIIKSPAETDYNFQGKFLWLPPCVDQERYYPRKIEKTDPVWSYLSELTGLPIQDIQNKRSLQRSARTDETKQKDVLIKSFSHILKQHPDSLLVVAIDETNQELAAKLEAHSRLWNFPMLLPQLVRSGIFCQLYMRSRIFTALHQSWRVLEWLSRKQLRQKFQSYPAIWYPL